MKLFEPLMLKFEEPERANDPELGLTGTILEEHPELIKMSAGGITAGQKESGFGRRGTPGAGQTARAAIYKGVKNLDCRASEHAREGSRICEYFVKTEPNRFQVYQKYISRVSAEKLERFMIAINRIAIEEGLEDVKGFRQGSTVIETNTHYPANNFLVRDCIKESGELLEHLKGEAAGFGYEEYKVKAKEAYFRTNAGRDGEKRVKPFKKRLKLFIGSINRLSNIVKKKSEYGVTARAAAALSEPEKLYPVMGEVCRMTERREALKGKVPAEGKTVSVYEQHTDITVKGKRGSTVRA